MEERLADIQAQVRSHVYIGRYCTIWCNAEGILLYVGICVSCSHGPVYAGHCIRFGYVYIILLRFERCISHSML